MNDKSLSSTTNTGFEHADTGGGSLLQHLWASFAVTILLGIICCGLYPLVIWGIGQTVFPNQANGSLVKKDGTPTSKVEEAVGSSLIGQIFTATQYFHPRPSASNNGASSTPGTNFASAGGYDPTASGATNYGPLSDQLINGATLAATTQPTTQHEALAFDGIRLRTLHYAMDNGLKFKLYNAADDGAGTRTEVPLAKFQDAQGNLNDVALVDAFPHPQNDAPDRIALVAGDFRNSDGTEVLIPGDAVTASASGLDPHISPANAAIQTARVAKARGITPELVQKLIAEHTDGRDLAVLGDPGVNVLLLNLALDAKYPVPAAPTTAPAAK